LPVDAVHAVIRADEAVLAVLLEAFRAARAGPARIDEAADAHQIARLVLCHVRAHRGHTADDFMTRHHRIHRVLPFVASLMQVRMAHAAKQHFHLHIMSAQFAALDFERGERRAGVGRGIGISRAHG